MDGKKIADMLKQQNKDAIMALQGGAYETAYKIFTQVLRAEVALELYDYAARTRVNMANTLYLMGRGEEALTCVEEALVFFEEVKDVKALCENRILKCQLLLESDRREAMEEEAKRLLADCGEETLKGQAYLYLYEAVMAKHRTREALQMINKSIQCFERAHDTNNMARALQCRIRYYMKQGQMVYAMTDREKLAKIGLTNEENVLI
ncbi:MAG: hypothetical protein IJ833_03445 [Lachnospiraceae bacterium]|nr:hypothetical protein [Lachnospiraceae bacterium]